MLHQCGTKPVMQPLQQFVYSRRDGITRTHRVGGRRYENNAVSTNPVDGIDIAATATQSNNTVFNATLVFNQGGSSSRSARPVSPPIRYSWLRSRVRTDLSFRALSPLIDAGAVIPTRTTDFYGNPIYGTPDMGAIEYQPPYTMGADSINASGNIRIYADGKYRYTSTVGSGPTMNFSATPSGGTFSSFGSSDARPAWLDISNITWNTSGNYSKEWTASGSGATTVVFTVGDLLPAEHYHVTVDGATSASITGTSCTAGLCQAGSDGKITFTYTGGWSSHTFAVGHIHPDTTPPSVPTNLSASSVSTSQINLTWTASTDNTSVTGYLVYRNGVQVGTSATNSYSDNNLSPSTSYSYAVSAYDAVGNNSAQSASASATTQGYSGPILVAWWKFDEGSGTSASDFAGTNTGTIAGAATWTAGKSGQALQFSGSGTVSALSDTSINFGTVISQS